MGLPDRITGVVLLAFAVTWCLLVWNTIPAGTPGAVGPRAFPLFLGLALAVLASLVLLKGFRRRVVPETVKADEDDVPSDRITIMMVVALFVTITVYGFLMEKIGFVTSTLVVVPALMVLVLRVRNRKQIAGMALGLAFGCWLVFGKLLGAYMPPGTWLSLF